VCVCVCVFLPLPLPLSHLLPRPLPLPLPPLSRFPTLSIWCVCALVCVRVCAGADLAGGPDGKRSAICPIAQVRCRARDKRERERKRERIKSDGHPVCYVTHMHTLHTCTSYVVCVAHRLLTRTARLRLLPPPTPAIHAMFSAYTHYCAVIVRCSSKRTRSVVREHIL